MIEDGGILYSQIDSQLPSFVSTDHTKFSKFIEKYYEFLELNLITFTDLDLNEDAILQEKANTTYTITVATGNNAYSNSANKFYVDGAVSPTITLTSGSYAIFDQGDETNDGHYFHISKHQMVFILRGVCNSLPMIGEMFFLLLRVHLQTMIILHLKMHL